MKDIESLKEKHNEIDSLWRNYFFEFKYCKEQIEFHEELESNFIGIALGYILDIQDIIFKFPNNFKDLSEKFKNLIALYQSIFIQQDLIKEVLKAFKIEFVADENYIINRKLRNTVIGHPISRKKERLESFSIFGFHDSKYIKYDRKNNFEGQVLDLDTLETIKRHYNFLNNYYELILQKCHKILFNFNIKITNDLFKINHLENEKLILFIEQNYPFFFKIDFAYKKNEILLILKKQDINNRYKNFILDFKLRFKKELVDLFDSINQHLPKSNKKELDSEFKNILIFRNCENSEYDYTINKLLKPRDKTEFKMHIDILKNDFRDNELILKELINMENNLDKPIEYYPSYLLLKQLI